MEYMPKEMRTKYQEIAKKLQKMDDIVLVYNYDADGISAGAIIAKTLNRLGKQYVSKALKQLYRETIHELKDLGENFFFVDFGSGQLDILKEEFNENFLVIDHHQAVKVDYPYHMNPFDYGIDGGTEISASGLCYLFAKTVNEKNSDLATHAIVGAVGDMQDFQNGELIGINAKILEDGIKAGVLKKETDLRLYGRISRPLTQFLMFSNNPIIPDLTANEENCIRFLASLGIELKRGEHWRSYFDLSSEEKKILTNALIVHLTKHDVPEWKIQDLIGDVYSLVNESPKTPLYDAKEYATLCNACGRHKMSDTALQVALGDRGEHYMIAMSMLQEHRRQLRDGILLMQSGIEEREAFYFFDAEDKIQESIVGIVAGMLYGSGVISPTKPIFALARNSDGSIKVSGRATKDLIRRGLNLGKTFKKLQAKFGEDLCQGGGHAIAAGCKFEETIMNDFLDSLSAEVKNQINLNR